MNIVLTGATGGVGQVLAQNLNASRLFLLYRDASKLAGATFQLRTHDYFTFRCDVMNEYEVKATFDLIDDIDVLINNAGITIDSKVKNMDVDAWDKVIATNLRGAFLCSKYAIPKMVEGGHIINISSVTSRIGAAGA
jgi:NAD(P)-dependent dehydrogenase (short-subunit alcohol dehydrogenase family)